ncbi:MAG: hypothetical protein GY940_32230, partial [bacterium]|nr:hypothetical protein [bacterium]
SGQEDIVIGSPTAGRKYSELQPVIGMFVNTLPLRTRPAGVKTFKEFLEEVKEQTLSALENQDYPFENLVEQVEVNRDVGRNPVFDVMFILQNLDQAREGDQSHITETLADDLRLKPYNYKNPTTKFDMTFSVVEREERLNFIVEYCTKLFDRSTIQRFIAYLKGIIANIMKKHGKSIWDISFKKKKKKEQILFTFND